MHRKWNSALLAGIALSISASSVFGLSPAAAKARKIKEISTPGVLSQWAFVEQRSYVFSRPSKSSQKITKLGLKTPEKTDNLVYVEAQTVGGAPWYRIRLPAVRTTGWVPRSALGGLQAVNTHLVINRGANTPENPDGRTLKLIKAGRTVFRFPIGVGKSGTPTPVGEFYVRVKLQGFKNAAYGKRALGLSATSEQLESSWPGGGFIGVHGTNEPGLIPGAISHGCVRLRNDDIDRLYRKVPVGTPVSIIESAPPAA